MVYFLDCRFSYRNFQRLVWQTSWQRISAAKTEKIAVRTVSTGFIITFLIAFFSIGIGIIAQQLLPANTDPDLVYTQFLAAVAHPAIGGLFMVSLSAAVLTGATSFLLSSAMNISKDIYQGWIKPEASSREVFGVSRLSVAGMAIVGLMVAPVLAAMFWRRATKSGVILSVIGSLIVSVTWSLLGQPFGFHVIIPGLLTSFVLLITLSLSTDHSKDETATAYYFDL